MEGKSFHYENLSTIKVIGHGKTILGMCKWVRRAKREKCRWKEKNKSFELCVTINNSIKGHMTLKNSEKRGENKEKWEKFWGHC
jgi:hypothetical protein